MESNQIETIKNKIKSKIAVGDYITLSKVLSTKRSTAVSRFNRNDEKAVLKMQQIVIGREKLTKRLQD